MEGIGSRSDKRVELVRDLCTGEGVTEAVTASRMDEIKAAFGDYDLDILEELFDLTMAAMPDSPYKEALVNAWRPSDGKNLTERRTDYAERVGSISTRTLIRHEQEGAELFVKFFDIVEGQHKRLKEEEESDDAARDADIEVLRRRVNDLEQTVLLLIAMLGDQGQVLLAKIRGQDISETRDFEQWLEDSQYNPAEIITRIYNRQQEKMKDIPID